MLGLDPSEYEAQYATHHDLTKISPTPNDTVVVIGNPPGGGGGGLGGGGLGGGGGAPGNSTVAPDPNPDPPPPYDNWSDRTCALNDIAKVTDGLANAHSSEHDAVVFKTSDGVFHTSPVFDSNRSDGKLTTASLDAWMSGNGITWNMVTDFVHNHDSNDYATSTQEAEINRYLSGNVADPNGQDWNAADAFIQRGADPSQFNMDIIDTSGLTHDFSYSQESYYKGLSISDMESGVGLNTNPACPGQ